MTQMKFETLWPQPDFKEVAERIKGQYGIMWKIDGVEIRIWGGKLETLVHVSQSDQEYDGQWPPSVLETLWYSQLHKLDARLDDGP